MARIIAAGATRSSGRPRRAAIAAGSSRFRSAVAVALKQLEAPSTIAARRNRPLEDVAPAAIIRAAQQPSEKVTDKATDKVGA